MPPARRIRDVIGDDPWLYRDAHYLVAEVELDAKVAGQWVPRPLRLAAPGRATLFTGYFPNTSFGSTYREAGVFFDVVHHHRRAVFSPWMVVDDDVALIVGRELLGYPKKLADIEWALDGDRIRSAARRRGGDLLRMEGTLGARIDAPPPIIGRPHRNLRTAIGIAIPKLVAFTPRERVIEVRHAQLDLHVAGTARDPLHEMGFGRVLACRLHRVDIRGGQVPVPVGVVWPFPLGRHLLVRCH
jgi:acetoacetate decarboxylase